MKKMSIANAEHYSWGDNCHGWHLVNQPTLSVIRERMPPDSAEVKHFHHHSRQFFWILAGTAELIVADSIFILEANEGLEIPPGTSHQIRNRTAPDLEFLVVSQPHSHGDRQLVSSTPA